MAELRIKRAEPARTKLRNVPIAVTPEGFWCCPAPVVFQKSVKNLTSHNRSKSSPSPSPPPPPPPMSSKATTTPPTAEVVPPAVPRSSDPIPGVASERAPKPSSENPRRKISVGFGKMETSDLKIVLTGKEGITVRMSVHKEILLEQSMFFAEKLSVDPRVSCVEIGDCKDVEIYVETVGLMYCREVKQRLIRQNVRRVLRILKVAETLGFRTCIKSCLEYLEAVPWVGEEEENIVSSIRHLKGNSYGASPLLKRVSSDATGPLNDTLSHILQLVLKSNDDRGRREMKSLVVKLLKENSHSIGGSVDVCSETLYDSCRNCLDSLLTLFKQASEPVFAQDSLENKDCVTRKMALEVDNLLWLVEILADRQMVDEFALMWVNQNELAALHPKLPTMTRHSISCITARLFVAVGRGEMLPLKETRLMLLRVWLQPLIDDYAWLQHGCKSFDRNVVEEGIGRTILTLPLEDQQSIMLWWLGCFLKVGDKCPNLQRAFEVWWRRTFVRPYVEQQIFGTKSRNKNVTSCIAEIFTGFCKAFEAYTEKECNMYICKDVEIRDCKDVEIYVETEAETDQIMFCAFSVY